MQHTIQQEIKGVVAFIAVIWFVFFLECVSPFPLESLGVTPRTLVGLAGIPAMPFLHGNLAHIVSNTVPLFVLLVLLAGSRARSREVVVDIILLGGMLLWLFGRPATHVGASGLIYGLVAFLIVSGFMERRLVSAVIAAMVLFLYGGSLLLALIPQWGGHVSWDGHLCGAAAGGAIAYRLIKKQDA